jgi:DNA-binding MarR family transcriptional regulator
LESAGYVQRCSDPSDGRAKLVFLTEKGAEVTTKIHAAIKGIDAGYRARVGAERYSAMKKTLADLLDALGNGES